MPATHAEIWAALALLPLLFYASALSRGKPAPKLRSPFAPYVLLLLCVLAVYFTGHLASPLFGLYALLTCAVAAFAGLLPALALAGAASLLEFTLARHEAELSLAPLALPWAGVILGRFTAFFASSVVSPASPSSAAAPAAAGRRPLAAAEASTVESVPMIDTRELLDRNLASLLDLAYHAHPNWNALLLLWLEDGQLACRQALVRQGELRRDFRVASGDGLLGWGLRDKKKVEIGDLAASTASALPYYEGEVKAKALLATPFFDEGEFLGMLVLDRAEAGAWTADEVKAAEFLGRQVVQQSQLAGYFGRVQSSGRQFNELYEISKQLADDLDRDALIARIPELLGRLCRFDSFYLSMRDGDEGPFEIVASQGYATGFQGAYKLEEGTVLGGWVLSSGEPLSFNAGHAEASVPQFLSEGLDSGAASFLLVPLMRHRRVSGLLKLDRQGHHAFTEADKEVALIFASQAAVTLEHARLYTLHKRMATTDGLTGMYNHRYFQERLALEIETSKRTGKPLSLALTDIDFFKKFNDSFGHQEGDNVLRKASKLIRDTVRQGKDVVCRYGGEEFVIIMPDCDLVEAREVSERVRQACADTLIGGTGPEARAITLSIGLCSHPQGAQEQRDIIHKADEALYKAKQTGRNRTCSFKDLP